MQINCAPVCQSCQMLSVETRCPVDPDAPLAWKPGDVHRFFSDFTSNPDVQKYEPRVLARPNYADGDTEETADYQLGPWVVILDNFISDEEADRLIELGALEGYERSSDVGKMRFDGTFENNVNNGRTSENAWCQNACYNDTVAQKVIHRIAQVTNIPEENSEYLQLLRYQEGQYYQTHHDLIGHQLNRQPGVRIMTFYMYLNDVEEGGGTQFPKLGPLTVMPKKGRALIWPSVLDEDPDKMDKRMDHQAMPVIKGVKYGANAWIHQRDFKGPNKNGCQ
jgi:prolyl 4-hydroxylase